MSDIKTKYGANAQTITVTLASLASASARESTAIDNRTDLFLDALVFVQVKFANTAVGTDPFVYVYVAGTVDDGTTWPDAVTGSDAAITLDATPNVRLLGAVFAVQNTTKKSGPWSVAQAFGGAMPAKWSIVIKNNSGIALTSTESDHKKLYQGIYAQAS
jgi:hypothetical protein